MITMGLVGLWHGAGWNYILWGLYHGVYLNIGAVWKRANRQIHPALEKGIFLFFILIGWALFMGQSAEYLAHLFSQLFGFGGLGSRTLILSLLSDNSAPALLFAIFIMFSGVAESANLEKRLQGSKYALLALGMVAALCVLLIEKQTITPFIYIEF
jgi:alginate O-acetyltransferase complex protein AlgI